MIGYILIISSILCLAGAFTAGQRNHIPASHHYKSQETRSDELPSRYIMSKKVLFTLIALLIIYILSN